MMNEHPEFEDLSAFVDGEAPEWQDHVDSCAACRADVDRLRAVTAAVGRPVPPVAADVRERTLSIALDALGPLVATDSGGIDTPRPRPRPLRPPVTESRPVVVAPPPPRWRAKGPWVAVGSVAAVLLAFVLGAALLRAPGAAATTPRRSRPVPPTPPSGRRHPRATTSTSRPRPAPGELTGSDLGPVDDAAQLAAKAGARLGRQADSVGGKSSAAVASPATPRPRPPPPHCRRPGTAAWPAPPSAPARARSRCGRRGLGRASPSWARSSTSPLPPAGAGRCSSSASPPGPTRRRSGFWRWLSRGAGCSSKRRCPEEGRDRTQGDGQPSLPFHDRQPVAGGGPGRDQQASDREDATPGGNQRRPSRGRPPPPPRTRTARPRSRPPRSPVRRRRTRPAPRLPSGDGGAGQECEGPAHLRPREAAGRGHGRSHGKGRLTSWRMLPIRVSPAPARLPRQSRPSRPRRP